jgi:hypothetical protein
VTRGAGLWTASTVHRGPCPLSLAPSRLTMDQAHRASSLLPPLHLLYSHGGAFAGGELACLHATVTRHGRQGLLWFLGPRPSQRWGQGGGLSPPSASMGTAAAALPRRLGKVGHWLQWQGTPVAQKAPSPPQLGSWGCGGRRRPLPASRGDRSGLELR